ncbi:MAG: Hpt domain-containing protein [Gemmatimonadaceae bacterium]
MSQPALLDFFILEASEYVERLDVLVSAAGTTGPDSAELARLARALRGSATMARASGLAELAGGVERAARSLRDGALWWDAALSGAFVAAIDDFKILLRALRTWGAGEDARVRARVAELAALAPPWRGGATPATGGAAAVATTDATASLGGAARYLATAAGGIVAALDELAARPASREAVLNVLNRVRALRGVAAVKDLPPLGEVVDAVERAAKPAELGGGAPGPAHLALLAAAASVLRRVSAELLAGRRPEAAAPDVERLAAAAAALEAQAPDAERIVPIAELFFADAGPHVVVRAPNPPTTPAERFRLEVVSQAEHLRRLVADARDARAGGGGERASRELRNALHALEEGAHGFGEREVQGFVASFRDAAVALDEPALQALDEVAALLADPATQSGELARRLGELSRGRAGARGDAAPAAPSVADAGVPRAPTPARRTPGRGRARQATPTGRDLHALLESGIAGFSLLDQQPLSAPTQLAEEMDVVPVDALLYTGRAALDRARELRDRLRASLPAAPRDAAAGDAGRAQVMLDRATLDELLDLLDLATLE